MKFNILFEKIKNLIKERVFQITLLGILFFILLIFVTTVDFSPPFSLEVGERSTRDIRAPRSALYIDKEETERQREKAADEVKEIYEYDYNIILDVEKTIRDTFDKIYEVNIKGGNEEKRINVLQKILNIKLSKKNLLNSVNMDTEVIEQIKNSTIKIVKTAMEKGIRANVLKDMISAKEFVRKEVKKLPFQERYLSVISEIGTKVIQPTTIFNKRKTEHEKIKAKNSVKPVTHPIFLGEIIIKKDEVVKPIHLVKMEAVGLRHRRLEMSVVLGIAILNLIFILTVISYLKLYHEEILSKVNILLLLSLITLSVLFIAKLINNPFLSGYQTIMPLISASMLFTILLNPQIAFVMSCILSIQLGIIMNNELRFTLLSFISCIISIYGVSKVHQRQDIVRAGLLVGIISVVIIFGLSLNLGEDFFHSFLYSSYGIVNGILSSILTIGGLFFLEKPFGISTSIQLLELANPNEPLMKRLMREAPGTYNHSVYVGNLAESAASLIDANPLLVRVGAYYHDIGKIKRPYFFIENQMNIDNLHEKISPEMSASIIKSHVSDGVEIARQYKLPQSIIEIIQEHHGTSLISFFYQQASNGNNSGDEKNYRYDSKKPQTKEAALVMFADSVEAAVRSLKEPVLEEIKEVVKKTIKTKFEDGQLDECNLTFKDIEKIINSFNNLLEGMFHPRIEYPKEKNSEDNSEDKKS